MKHNKDVSCRKLIYVELLHKQNNKNGIYSWRPCINICQRYVKSSIPFRNQFQSTNNTFKANSIKT